MKEQRNRGVIPLALLGSLASLAISVCASSQQGAGPDQVVMVKDHQVVMVKDPSGRDVQLKIADADLTALAKAIKSLENKGKDISDNKPSPNHKSPSAKAGHGRSAPKTASPKSVPDQAAQTRRQGPDNTASNAEMCAPGEPAPPDKSQPQGQSTGSATDHDKECTKEDVKKWAADLGLLKSSRVNPNLTFNDADAQELSNRSLGETQTKLELAARKAVLQAADRQGVIIGDAPSLAQAISYVLPMIIAAPRVTHESEQANPRPAQPQQTPVICGFSGDTSQAFIEHAWNDLKQKHYDQAAACAQVPITKWTRQADEQQAKAFKDGCQQTPSAEEKESYFRLNWALSDIAAGWFIRGEALYGQGQWAQAREAYKKVIDSYSCAFTWDPRGWFWRTSDAAKEKYDEIRHK